VLYAIALNSQGESLGFITVSTGTVGRAAVYPRNLLSFLLVEVSATQVILAHNHPSGTARASYEDKKVTKEIKELLSKLEVTLLDHLIYAPSFSGNKGTWVSFSADGIMP